MCTESTTILGLVVVTAVASIGTLVFNTIQGWEMLRDLFGIGKDKTSETTFGAPEQRMLTDMYVRIMDDSKTLWTLPADIRGKIEYIYNSIARRMPDIQRGRRDKRAQRLPIMKNGKRTFVRAARTYTGPSHINWFGSAIVDDDSPPTKRRVRSQYLGNRASDQPFHDHYDDDDEETLDNMEGQWLGMRLRRRGLLNPPKVQKKPSVHEDDSDSDSDSDHEQQQFTIVSDEGTFTDQSLSSSSSELSSSSLPKSEGKPSSSSSDSSQ
jgi:hypothetical protein